MIPRLVTPLTRRTAIRCFSKQRNKITAQSTRRPEWTAPKRTPRKAVHSIVDESVEAVKRQLALEEGPSAAESIKQHAVEVDAQVAELGDELAHSPAALVEGLEVLGMAHVHLCESAEDGDPGVPVIVGTAKSFRHAASVAAALAVQFKLTESDLDGLRDPESGWIVAELPDCRIHLFASADIRGQYNLEELIEARPSMRALAQEAMSVAEKVSDRGTSKRASAKAAAQAAAAVAEDSVAPSDMTMWKEKE